MRSRSAVSAGARLRPHARKQRQNLYGAGVCVNGFPPVNAYWFSARRQEPAASSQNPPTGCRQGARHQLVSTASAVITECQRWPSEVQARTLTFDVVRPKLLSEGLESWFSLTSLLLPRIGSTRAHLGACDAREHGFITDCPCATYVSTGD